MAQGKSPPFSDIIRHCLTTSLRAGIFMSKVKWPVSQLPSHLYNMPVEYGLDYD
jgi:hypothetical protein